MACFAASDPRADAQLTRLSPCFKCVLESPWFSMPHPLYRELSRVRLVCARSWLLCYECKRANQQSDPADLQFVEPT
jgi:hypothetical protein